MADALLAFAGDRLAPLGPPGGSCLLECLLTAIEMAGSPAGLEGWCADHAHILPRLVPDELEAVLSARLRRWAGWEIEALESLPALAAWWAANAAQIRGLVASDRDQVVTAKDRRKAALSAVLAPAAPPSVVRPYRAREAARESGRLL